MAAMDDEMKEDPIYSHLLDSLNSNLNDGTLSAEEVAWADSCLNKDVDTTDIDWNSVQDALLGILGFQPGELDSAAAENIRQTDDVELGSFRPNIQSLEFRSGPGEDEDLIEENIEYAESLGSPEEEDDDDLMLVNRRARARGKNRIKSVFQPHYREDIVDETPNSCLELSVTNELEPSLEDLFKIWDLEVPDEEDEFTTELNNALSEKMDNTLSEKTDSALSEIPPLAESTVDDPEPLGNLAQVSVDDLIAGLGDLSLEQDIIK